MTNTLSTIDVSVRWLDDAADSTQVIDTQHFLFDQEVGHLLVREPVSEESEAPSLKTVLPSSEQKITAPPRSEPVSVPRAQRVSTRTVGRYILLKKYEGVVTSRNEQSFTARLMENVSDYPVVEAEFDLEELSETDRTLAVEGAALVWTIGYLYDGSTRKRESTIYLRRLPPWSDKEIEQSTRAAEELTRGINWE